MYFLFFVFLHSWNKGKLYKSIYGPICNICCFVVVVVERWRSLLLLLLLLSIEGLQSRLGFTLSKSAFKGTRMNEWASVWPRIFFVPLAIQIRTSLTRFVSLKNLRLSLSLESSSLLGFVFNSANSDTSALWGVGGTKFFLCATF